MPSTAARGRGSTWRCDTMTRTAPPAACGASSDGRQSVRVVLVTGGSQGIGAAIVTAFAGIGDTVISADLQPGHHGSDVDTMICDFCDPTAAARLVSHAVDLHGRIDVVVNNVGIAPYRDSFLQVTDDDWEKSIEINLMTMVRLCRAAIPVMVN